MPWFYYIKLFQRNSWGITFRRERPGPKRGEAGHSKDDLVEVCCRGLLNHLRQKKPQTKYSCCLRFSFLMSDWLFPCKVLITFQMKYFCYKFMVFWVSWYYERQDLQDNILGSCLLWVMSTEILVDIAVDIAVDTRSTVGRYSVDTRSIVGRHSVDSPSILGRHSVDTRSTLGRHSGR